LRHHRLRAAGRHLGLASLGRRQSRGGPGPPGGHRHRGSGLDRGTDPHLGVDRSRRAELPGQRHGGGAPTPGPREHEAVRPGGHAQVQVGRTHPRWRPGGTGRGGLMFTGTKPVAQLKGAAAVMDSLDTDPARLEDVEVLTVTYETTAAAKERVLPAGLHPPNPPIVTIQVIACRHGPLGPFRMAQTRIGCRSGARPRAFLVPAGVDGEEAAHALSSRWGYFCRLGAVSMERFYDRVRTSAALAGREILDVEAVDPVALRASDIQWIANMNRS